MSTQTTFKILSASAPSVDMSLVQNAGSTAPGDPILGLAYNTSGITCYYRQAGTGTATSIALVTQTAGGAYSSGGFVKIDDTHMPGLYRFDIPTACVATAGEWNIELAGAPAGTVGNMEAHTIKLFVGDAMGLLTQQMTEGYPSLNTAPSLSQAQFMQMQRLAPTKRTIVGTTETVYKLDGVTVAFTYTLDFAGNPTTFTRAT